MVLQIGICDDVEMARETLGEKVLSVFREKAVDVQLTFFSSGEELIEEEKELDLVFLDIEMSGMGGIEAGRRYRRLVPQCKIVLASGRSDRMREALAVEPLAFVDKPYEDVSVLRAVEVFLSARVGYQKIVLYDNRNEQEIMQRDICYAYAYEGATEFVVADQVMRKEISLNQLEPELDERLFFRVDRQHIVNLRHVEKVENNKLWIGDKKISIAVRRQKEFKEKYQTFRLHYR